MKRAAIPALMCICMCIQVFAQDNNILGKPRIDERVELLSIVFRLAGNPEYSMTRFKLYTDEIERYFGSYRDHELVEFAKSARSKTGVGYDAVMSMALHMDDDLKLLKNVAGNSLDNRWGKKNAKKFTGLLSKFYKDTKADLFFNDNAALYAEASKRFLPVYEHLDLGWYGAFFGQEPAETFFIVNGLGNGGANYGVTVNYKNGKKDVFAVMGAWTTDDSGMPVFSIDGYFPTLVHEFSHSFVNHLIDKNRKALKTSGKKIFAWVKDEMEGMAYGDWEIMMYEALVRACVIKYMKDHGYGQSEIENAVNNEIGKGFLWINELVAELDNYGRQRDIYPTLESYMPRIIEAYDGYADAVVQIESGRPRIVSIGEFANDDTNVNADLKTITVNFDRPLSGQGYSIYLGSKGAEAFPKMGNISYADGNRAVVMEVQLEKGREYQFIMKGTAFISEEGIGIKDYEVNFKTAE